MPPRGRRLAAVFTRPPSSRRRQRNVATGTRRCLILYNIQAASTQSKPSDHFRFVPLFDEEPARCRGPGKLRKFEQFRLTVYFIQSTLKVDLVMLPLDASTQQGRQPIRASRSTWAHCANQSSPTVPDSFRARAQCFWHLHCERPAKSNVQRCTNVRGGS